MALPFLSWWSSYNESKWILNPIGLWPQFRLVEALLHLSWVPESRHFEDSGSAESPPARNSRSVPNGKTEHGVWPTWPPTAPQALLHHYLAAAGCGVLLLAHFQHRLCLPLYLLSSKWTAGSSGGFPGAGSPCFPFLALQVVPAFLIHPLACGYQGMMSGSLPLPTQLSKDPQTRCGQPLQARPGSSC